MNQRIALYLLLMTVVIGGVWAIRGISQEEGKLKNTRLQKFDRAVAAPEFDKISAWVNSEPIRLADQKGKVAIIHFWTNGCINCIHNYPHYRAWQKKFANAKDVLLVGVHTPEFDSEHDIERIRKRATENGLNFPIAVDNQNATWNAWSNRYWPCIYLVDKKSNVRARWIGELGDEGFAEVSGLIDQLLKE